MPRLTRQQAKKMKLKAVLQAARERAETRVSSPFNTNSIGTPSKERVEDVCDGIPFFRHPGSRISLPLVRV